MPAGGNSNTFIVWSSVVKVQAAQPSKLPYTILATLADISALRKGRLGKCKGRKRTFVVYKFTCALLWSALISAHVCVHSTSNFHVSCRICATSIVMEFRQFTSRDPTPLPLHTSDRRLWCLRPTLTVFSCLPWTLLIWCACLCKHVFTQKLPRILQSNTKY